MGFFGTPKIPGSTPYKTAWSTKADWGLESLIASNIAGGGCGDAPGGEEGFAGIEDPVSWNGGPKALVQSGLSPP